MNCPWPPLPFSAWRDTLATLHMWTQIVGKLRLAQTPWLNHSWHVTLYLTTRGLTTSPISYGARSFQIDFDFVAHQLLLHTSDGAVRTMPLVSRSVADFYRELFSHLRDLDLIVVIRTLPNEVPIALPFDEDEIHRDYDRVFVERWWQIMVQSDRLLKLFRARFHGKASPVHFFWGSFDLAVTRFSGRPAPRHPGGVPNLPDWVAEEAYSHEVSSCGFWPGNDQVPYPAFYSYAYPEPDGFKAAHVRPAAAAYDTALSEYLLPYDRVREAADPDETLLDFLQSTYEAAADLGRWDRSALERPWFHAPLLPDFYRRSPHY